MVRTGDAAGRVSAATRRYGAIHQPTFLPWLGFFEKLQRASLFVFFDTVQFPRGKSRGSRVQILRAGEPTWLTMPVLRSDGQRFCDVRMSSPQYHWAKLLKTLQHAYADAPHHEEVMRFLGERTPVEDETLADFNIDFVVRTAARLGLDDTTVVRSSEREDLRRATSTGTDLIVETCRAFSIDDYLSGDGSGDYLRPEAFPAAGIALTFQEFRHPVYAQAGASEFTPGLSIVDALMNCGWEGTGELL